MSFNVSVVVLPELSVRLVGSFFQKTVFQVFQILVWTILGLYFY